MRKLIPLFIISAYVFSVAAAETGAPVRIAIAETQAIYQRVPLTGTITSERVAQLSVSTSGLVSTIRIEEGSRVAKGDMLIALDSELAQLQVQGADARVKQLENAWRDAQRRLKEAQALSPNIAESAIRDIEAEVSEDKAQLQQAKADLAYQQALLKRHRLSAPFSGVVSAKLTELGEWVDPGQGVLELVSLDSIRADFKVAEDYLARIDSDATLHFTLNAYPEQSYQVPVGMIVPVSDPNARTFLLRAPLNNKNDNMIPGMSVTAQLKIPAGREAVVVSRDAILRTPDSRVVVWTLKQEDNGYIVEENTVVTGLVFDNMVEILDGLSSGERVVVEGNESLQRGQQVYIADD